MISINKIITNSIVITTGGDDLELKTPLYFEANEPGASVAMLCWDDYTGEQTDLKCHLQYSTDKMATWETYGGSIVELDDCTDNRVYFRADPANPNTNGFCKKDDDYGECWWHYFKTDGSVKAGGNIQFLLESTGTRTDVPTYGFSSLFGTEEYNGETEQSIGSCSSLTTAPELPATRLATYCYDSMFQGCSSLTAAPELPATTLASDCYSGMFQDCTSLTQAPALPATTLANFCYYYMFYNCSSLITAPALPATTLANFCYESMFRDCTSLTTAPTELPATTLTNRCYWQMFQNCTSLATAPELPATTLATSCYSGMFQDCTSLTSAPVLPATTLGNGCYSNMFQDCSKLASIDVSFTAWNPTNATSNWMLGAGTQATGTKTFTCPAALPKTTGNYYIPDGWTIVEK